MPVPRLLALVVLVACLAGCSSEPARKAAPAPESLRLDASVTQFRFDEGTRNLRAGVTNNGAHDIRVSHATIAWDGFVFHTVPIRDGVVPPGQAAAFTITYGAAKCAQPPATRPTLLVVVDGRTRRLPLRVEDPGLLVRLRTKACAQQRLDATATVHLRTARQTTRLRGEEFLPGVLVLRRRPGTTGRVGVVDLAGSVLIDLEPSAGRHALPAVLRPQARMLRFPVLLGSAHRCDAHALGQSSQTFLISAYVRLEGAAIQRKILPLDTAERDRLSALVYRGCR
jgi:hypothetical protein